MLTVECIQVYTAQVIESLTCLQDQGLQAVGVPEPRRPMHRRPPVERVFRENAVRTGSHELVEGGRVTVATTPARRRMGGGRERESVVSDVMWVKKKKKKKNRIWGTCAGEIPPTSIVRPPKI